MTGPMKRGMRLAVLILAATFGGAGYAHGICDKITGGTSYAKVMGDVKNDVLPNDEYSSNYLISDAVNIYCPVSYGSCARRREATCHRRSDVRARLVTILMFG
jgi:hypothetical protein